MTRANVQYRLLAIWTFALSLACPSFGFDRAHFDALNHQAKLSIEKQDWNSVRSLLIEMGRELSIPSPNYMLQMASVENRLGSKAEALSWMKRYAATGLSFNPHSSPGLKSLASDKAFQKISADMQNHAEPVSRLDVVCALPLADLRPEDITFEAGSGDFIVSSLDHHTAFRVMLPKQGVGDCSLKEIPLEESIRRWPVMAVSFDRSRNVLWLTSSAMPDYHGVPASDSGKAMLYAVDATSGKILRQFAPETNSPAVLGDMLVASDGTVYVTDSLGGGVYRVQGDLTSAKLDKVADGFFSPQTPALAADGKRLFVADYSMGIGVIDLTTRATGYLKHPENIAVTGLDGLYLSGDSLIGVQNGTQPERIVRYRLNRAQTEIVEAEVLQQAPHLDPTHAAFASGTPYFVANVGWDKVDDHGDLKSGEKFTAPLLLKLSR